MITSAQTLKPFTHTPSAEKLADAKQKIGRFFQQVVYPKIQEKKREKPTEQSISGNLKTLAIGLFSMQIARQTRGITAIPLGIWVSGMGVQSILAIESGLLEKNPKIERLGKQALAVTLMTLTSLGETISNHHITYSDPLTALSFLTLTTQDKKIATITAIAWVILLVNSTNPFN
jgi:hypothetical protein